MKHAVFVFGGACFDQFSLGLECGQRDEHLACPFHVFDEQGFMVDFLGTEVIQGVGRYAGMVGVSVLGHALGEFLEHVAFADAGLARQMAEKGFWYLWDAAERNRIKALWVSPMIPVG